MAQTAKIIEKDNTVTVVVDGNKIHGVERYKIENAFDGDMLYPAKLTLKVAVTEVEVQIG